jgi:hypothetical protein
MIADAGFFLHLRDDPLSTRGVLGPWPRIPSRGRVTIQRYSHSQRDSRFCEKSPSLEIALETHWRVKVVIVKLIPFVTRVLGLDAFTKKLFPIINKWLSDQIFSARETMTMQLGSPLLFWRTNDQKISQQIQACIKKPCNDPDTEVSYFAWGVQLKC